MRTIATLPLVTASLILGLQREHLLERRNEIEGRTHGGPNELCQQLDAAWTGADLWQDVRRHTGMEFLQHRPRLDHEVLILPAQPRVRGGSGDRDVQDLADAAAQVVPARDAARHRLVSSSYLPRAVVGVRSQLRGCPWNVPRPTMTPSLLMPIASTNSQPSPLMTAACKSSGWPCRQRTAACGLGGQVPQ